ALLFTQNLGVGCVASQYLAQQGLRTQVDLGEQRLVGLELEARVLIPGGPNEIAGFSCGDLRDFEVTPNVDLGHEGDPCCFRAGNRPEWEGHHRLRPVRCSRWQRSMAARGDTPSRLRRCCTPPYRTL